MRDGCSLAPAPPSTSPPVLASTPASASELNSGTGVDSLAAWAIALSNSLLNALPGSRLLNEMDFLDKRSAGLSSLSS